MGDSIANLALKLPFPTGDVLTGLKDISPLLASAIPLGIYNFTEGMNNVESAEAAGDATHLPHPAGRWVGAVIGSILGSPSRRRCTSATPAGRRSAAGSAIRS